MVFFVNPQKRPLSTIPGIRRQGLSSSFSGLRDIVKLTVNNKIPVVRDDRAVLFDPIADDREYTRGSADDSCTGHDCKGEDFNRYGACPGFLPLSVHQQPRQSALRLLPRTSPAGECSTPPLDEPEVRMSTSSAPSIAISITGLSSRVVSGIAAFPCPECSLERCRDARRL